MGEKMKTRLIFSIMLFLPLLLTSCGEDCTFNRITNETLKDAVLDQAYNEVLNYDITCSYTSKFVELTAGKLPPGIELKGSGEFSGIPTETGTFKFTVKMRICFSSNGFQYTDCTDKSKEFTITVKEE